MSTFRVLQFNMQFGQVWDDAYPDRAPINLDATIAEIRRHRAPLAISPCGCSRVLVVKPGASHA